MAASFWTVALTVAVPPGIKLAGELAMAMLNVPELETVMVADATAAGLLVDVAVIVTEPAVAGAVYVVDAPLAV